MILSHIYKYIFPENIKGLQTLVIIFLKKTFLFSYYIETEKSINYHNYNNWFSKSDQMHNPLELCKILGIQIWAFSSWAKYSKIKIYRHPKFTQNKNNKFIT